MPYNSIKYFEKIYSSMATYFEIKILGRQILVCKRNDVVLSQLIMS